MTSCSQLLVVTNNLNPAGCLANEHDHVTWKCHNSIVCKCHILCKYYVLCKYHVLSHGNAMSHLVEIQISMGNFGI